MLKLISLNYTVMLNGYSQYVNIAGGGGGGNFIEKSVIGKKDAIKQI